jgi:hypothetical protein
MYISYIHFFFSSAVIAVAWHPSDYALASCDKTKRVVIWTDGGYNWKFDDFAGFSVNSFLEFCLDIVVARIDIIDYESFLIVNQVKNSSRKNHTIAIYYTHVLSHTLHYF